MAGARLPRARRRDGVHPRRTPRRVSTLVGVVDSGLIDFDLAVNLTRAVGQTMARLADWEVAALVQRVEEPRPATQATGSRLGLGAADRRGVQRAVRGAAALRLAPPPRRRGGPASRRWAPTRRTCTPPSSPSASPTSSASPRCPTSSPRTGSATWSSCSSPRCADVVAAAARPGHQEHRRLGAVRERRPDPRPTTPPRGSSTSSAATPGCPTSGSGWPAARS